MGGALLATLLNLTRAFSRGAMSRRPKNNLGLAAAVWMLRIPARARPYYFAFLALSLFPPAPVARTGGIFDQDGPGGLVFCICLTGWLACKAGS